MKNIQVRQNAVVRFVSVYYSFCFVLFCFVYFAHTNNYNTLHLQFITGNCYRLQKRNKKKKKDKVHKNTMVYILTINRRLPALWASITHLPVCHLHFINCIGQIIF